METGKYSASFMNVTEGHEAWMMTITQERPCLDRRFIKMLIRAAVPEIMEQGIYCQDAICILRRDGKYIGQITFKFFQICSSVFLCVEIQDKNHFPIRLRIMTMAD